MPTGAHIGVIFIQNVTVSQYLPVFVWLTLVLVVLHRDSWFEGSRTGGEPAGSVSGDAGTAHLLTLPESTIQVCYLSDNISITVLLDAGKSTFLYCYSVKSNCCPVVVPYLLLEFTFEWNLIFSLDNIDRNCDSASTMNLSRRIVQRFVSLQRTLRFNINVFYSEYKVI